MATYKVPQDVEAEDKLIGPLTFKQFIFAMLFAAFAAATFFAGRANIFIGAIFLPFDLVFAVLAFYRRPDQQVETYLLALIGFLFRPRKRIWDRDGVLEHVEIKAPKKVEVTYNDGRSRAEVKNQLQKLGRIVDTRGWSSKNASLNQAYVQNPANDNDDRLVSLDELAAPQAVSDVIESDDPYSQTSNVQNNVDQQLQESTKTVRSRAQEIMEKARQVNA